MEGQGIPGIAVVKDTVYSAFMLNVEAGKMGPIDGCYIRFTEPSGHRHSYFCAGQTIADMRLQLAAAGYSGIETVGDIPS